MAQSIGSMIEVRAAYKGGKQIECSYDDGRTWQKTDQPTWDFDTIQYRIAPESKRKVKLVAFIDSHGELRWIREELFVSAPNNRVPSEDKEVEL